MTSLKNTIIGSALLAMSVAGHAATLRITEGSAKNLMENIPWTSKQHWTEYVKYSYVSEIDPDAEIISCTETNPNLGHGHSFVCLMDATVPEELQTESTVTIYSPDYDWNNAKSFFYKLAHSLGGISHFDYGSVKGSTFGHWYAILSFAKADVEVLP